MEYDDASFFYTTYSDMCLTDRLQVDTTKTIYFIKRSHLVLEYNINYFGSTAAGLNNFAEQDKHPQVHSIFSETDQLNQTLLHREA